jgi:voltage-dependent potassium channel beta subunit
MQYRRLGRSGLQVSELSLGSWVTYHNQVDTKAAVEMLAAAYDAGINFFDNAEGYALGKSEEVMGAAIKQLGWARHRFVVSSKFYWGIDNKEPTANFKNTLNRKYLLHAIDGSLKRFGFDHLDLIFCHRPDPHTPIEETVWAMSDIINRGKALYWGTSEWSADEIRAAYEIAERHHLHKPVMEQPQYNLFHRQRVEKEYARLYEDLGLGLTTWSPLASGLLTGKYRNGIPAGSRGSIEAISWIKEQLLEPKRNAAVAQLESLAGDLGCNVAQLAIAWANRNPNVSTVILGASKLSQLKDNLGALAVTPKLTAEILKRMDEICLPLSQ